MGSPEICFSINPYRLFQILSESVMVKFFKLLSTAANRHLDKAGPDPSCHLDPVSFYNTSNNRMKTPMHFVEVLENYLAKKFKKNYKPCRVAILKPPRPRTD